MPLIYGEGDNAFRRLKEEINKQFGSNVAARLDAVSEVRSPRLCGSPAPLNSVAHLLERASDFNQLAQALRSDVPRPAKRARTSHNTNVFDSADSFPHGNTIISHMESMSGHIKHLGQGSRDVSMTISEDRYNTLVKSLLFERIDFRVNNVKNALLSTCQWLFRHPHFQKAFSPGGRIVLLC